MSESGIDITTAQRKLILDLLGKYLPNTSAWVYGSRVTWKTRPQSDLDMVVFATPEQAHAVANLKEAFEESDLPFRVDLFAWHEVPEQFQKNITAEHVVLVERQDDSVPDGWKQYRLSEVITLIGGGTPKRSVSEYWGGSIPWLSVKDFNNGFRYVDGAQEHITYIGLSKSSTKMLNKGQLIISARGTVGALAQLSQPMTFNQSCYGIDAKSEFTENDFLYYLIKHSIEKFKQITHGAVFDTITLNTFDYIHIKLPPLPEQRSIAHILGSLDDKIALNRRMNATLEGMAQALFQSWFVDFDPVIDKALAAGNSIPEPLQARAALRESLGNARKPLPEDIQELFPDAFEDTEEMGWVPMGWKVQPIEGLTRLIGGGTPKTSVASYWAGDIPWFSVVDAPSPSDVFVIDTERHITQEGVNKSSTSILPVGTTIISARGTVGKCAMVGKPMAMNQSCYGVTGTDGISDYFVYYVVREKVADLQRHGHGSVFNTITRDTFKTIFMPFSGTKLTQVFGNDVNSFFQKILINCFEIQKLTDIRDNFLPKLLSGELRVVDAEKFFEVI